jgi:hypothetical protein
MSGMTPILENITSKLEETQVGRGVLSLAGNKEWELNLSPQGKATKAMLEEYHRIRATSLGESTKHLNEINKFHFSSDAIRNSESLDQSPISNYAKHAGSNPNHPVNQAISALTRQDPTNAALSQKALSEKIRGKARLDGIQGSFGPKYQNIAPIVADLFEHSDPRVNMHGQRILDIVSNELHDTKIGAQGAKVSDVKSEVRGTFKTLNKIRAKLGSSTQLKLPTADPTYYPPSEAEKTANKVLRTIQIPFVAIPHIGQYFHLGASAPILQGVGKALLQMDKVEMQKTVEASGILANTQWDVIHSDLLARTGKVAKWTNSPTAASIIQKSIHTPLFNWMRLRQLSAAGSVGFHSAIFWAHNAVKGDKRAIAELLEMGLDPVDIAKRGGQLTPEELQKGVYHFVNNRFFFDKSIDNSLYQNKNIIARSAYMYHSFVNSEVSYIGRELHKMGKAGDIKGIAQFVGTLGILFPAVAPMLKSAELLMRTGSTQQAGDSIRKDYSNLSGANGPAEAIGTYIEMISHIGAMGTYLNYTNAIKGHRLANAMLGPMIGMGATDIEDISAAAMGKSKRPLGRDITQMLPLVGKPLSHKLFPTTKEEKEGKPQSFKFRRSGRRRYK